MLASQISYPFYPQITRLHQVQIFVLRGLQGWMKFLDLIIFFNFNASAISDNPGYLITDIFSLEISSCFLVSLSPPVEGTV